MRFISERTQRGFNSSSLRLVSSLADRRHGFPLARAADDLLHHAVGARGRRGSVFGAQRTQPRCDRHQPHPHGGLLLSVLAGGHLGPGQPSVRPSAEERNHLVPALLLGVKQDRVT